MSNLSILQFTSFSTKIDPIFWLKLSQKKLNEQKLNTDLIPIVGNLQFYQECIINLDENSFLTNPDVNVNSNKFGQIPGFIKNVNTKEEFKEMNKNQLLKEISLKLLENLNKGIFHYFLIFTFADLKKYQFWFYTALPILLPENPFLIENQLDESSSNINV